jgi:peptide/nickel transport system ATP-binding protein
VPRLETRRPRLASIPGTVPPPTAFPRGCRFGTRCPLADARCHAEAPPLAVPSGADHAVACWKAPLERHAGIGRAA